MARPLRIEYPGAWYHVMNRGRRGDKVFLSDQDYQYFVDLLEEVSEVWHWRVAAYCLMPTHYHLLVQTPDANISRCMRHINGVYTQHFNRRHDFDGQLFRGRYKSILIDADSYLLELVRYIHQNPLKAGLIDNLDTYAWSSHKNYVSNSKKCKWLFKDYVLDLFSKNRVERIRRYRTFISEEQNQEIHLIFDAKKRPSLLGSERFIQWIKDKFYEEKQSDEIPQAKELSPEPEQIKKIVSEFYGIEKSELMRGKRGILNEPRNVAIYLTRRLRPDSLKRIGAYFDIGKYSSVSSAIERVGKSMAEDRSLRERIERLTRLIKSQEQT